MSKGTDLMLIVLAAPPAARLTVATLGVVLRTARLIVALAALNVLSGFAVVPIVAVTLVTLSVPPVRLIVADPPPAVMPVLAVTIPPEMLSVPEAVSYTHLDVYKRQP